MRTAKIGPDLRLIIFRLFVRHVYVWNTLSESNNMFLAFVVEQVTLHMLTSFLSVNGSGFEAKLSVKALAIMWVTVIG